MSRTINNDLYAEKMEVTIYPYQDVASIDADQILLNIVKPGVFNAYVINEIDGDNIDTTIKAGTTIVFRKSFTDVGKTRDFIVKIEVIDDIIITTAKTTLNAVTDESLCLVCAWDWEETYTTATKKYATFKLVGGTDATLYTNYLQYGDAVVCELLNHLAVKDTGGNGTYAYPVAYQNLYARQADPAKVIKDYRDTFEHLNNGANQFNLQFGKKVETLAGPTYKTKVYCVSGYGIIRDTVFSIDETTDGLADILELVPADQLASGTYQVDILRLIISDDVSNTPQLEWTSVSSSTSPGTVTYNQPLTLAGALACLGTQQIPFIDDGIIIGIAVRTRANIGDGQGTGTPPGVNTYNALWPYQFVRWNPIIPFIGHTPTTTRFAVPLYAESEIDWT